MLKKEKEMVLLWLHEQNGRIHGFVYGELILFFSLSLFIIKLVVYERCTGITKSL